MNVDLTARDLLLIRNALYILESQLYADEVDRDICSDLGNTEPEEVRDLMDRLVPENIE